MAALRKCETTEGESEGGEGERTDLDAGDAEAAGLEDDADAAGSDALAEATDDAAGDQHVLGRRPPLLRRRRHGRRQR